MLTEVSMSSCDWVCLMQLLVYVPVLVLGIPLNLAALWKLLSIRRWRESTVYLLNLIINDTLLLLSLPFKIHAYNRNWHLGRPFCSLLESLVYVNVYGSILLSVCIAGDRFVALRFPFAARRLRSPLKAALICLVIWMLVFSCSYPVYSLNHDNTSSSFCFQNFSNRTWENRWIVVSMETVFCCSTVVMVFCSVEVVRLLRDLRKRNPNDPKLRNNKSVKIVLSNLLAFLVCFIPYHIVALLYFHYKTSRAGSDFIRQLRYFVHSSLCVGSVNCLADGACYYYILKENLHTAKLERRATLQSTHIRHKNVQSHNPSTPVMVREASEESRDPRRLKNGSSDGSVRGKN